MTKKIRRNDPCPCGSGKKYKRCCLDMKKPVIEKSIPIPEIPSISPLALMRFQDDLMEDNEKFENISKDLEKNRKISLRNSILERWNLKKIRQMTTSEIIDKLKSMNLRFEIEEFKNQAENYISAIDLSEDFYYTQDFHSEGLDEDFIWLGIMELWNRLIPEKINMEMIDDFMWEGYSSLNKDDYRNGMEKWEKTWNSIKSIVPAGIKSVTDADKFIPNLTQSIFNWCQDYEMELGNAATEDDLFCEKRIKYCQDFCRIFPQSDELIILNMNRAEAESYASTGDVETAEKLFKELTNKFPDNVWGYISWGDIYCGDFYSKVPGDFVKAEEIYRLGLDRCDTELEAIHERMEDLEDQRTLNPMPPST